MIEPFKPRIWQDEKLVFTPGVSTGSLKKIRSQIKEQWWLKSCINQDLREIAKEVDIKIMGWIEYYGHHRRSDLNRLACMIDNYFAEFIKKKSKVNNTWSKAWKRLMQIKAEHPKIFSHWHKIIPSKRRAVVLAETFMYRYNNVANSLEIMQIIPRAFTLNNPGEKFTCEVNSLSSSLKIVYPCLNLME